MRDPNCIFCRILSGEIPGTKVLENEACTAFLDIGPLADGHVLLVLADHVETVDQMTPDQAADMLRRLPALVRAVQAATGCEGVNVLQNNGAAASQLVMHVHFHIIPRNSGDAFGFNWPAGTYAEGRAEEIARAIREHLA